jgi:hypothetical protein
MGTGRGRRKRPPPNGRAKDHEIRQIRRGGGGVDVEWGRLRRPGWLRVRQEDEDEGDASVPTHPPIRPYGTSAFFLS